MSTTLIPLPTIFEYENYRLFLKDMYKAMKSRDRKYSLRYWARIAGFNSHNFLRQIMEGKNNLSLESINKVATALKMSPEEALFFKNLVLLNQATSTEEKQLYAEKILNSSSYKRIHPLNESKFRYFAKWYYSAIREMVSFSHFVEDPHWVASHLIPHIRPHEAKTALDELLKLGLLKRDENGRLQQTEVNVATPLEVSSAYISNWHRESMKRASESIDQVPREKRDITAVSFSFSKKNIKVIKELVDKVRKEIALLSSQQQDPDIIMQLNLHLFPLAEVEESEN